MSFMPVPAREHLALADTALELFTSADFSGPELGVSGQERFNVDWLAKRTIDLAVAVPLFILVLPILLLIGLIIRVTSSGPVLYLQARCGRDGRLFKAAKFCTMVVDAEERLQELLRSDPAARREYETYHKLRDDPRVTAIGRFLRKSSLDELPQLWNVIRGDMSLVGPRPYLPRELPAMGSLANRILATQPGITGLWQVSKRNEASFAERLSIDCEYVRIRSVWLDLSLLFRTVPAVLAAGRAC